MTPEEELKLLEELELNDKMDIVFAVFYDEGDSYGKITSDGVVEIIEEASLMPKMVEGKKMFKVDEVKKLFPNALIIEICFVDFS